MAVRFIGLRLGTPVCRLFVRSSRSNSKVLEHFRFKTALSASIMPKRKTAIAKEEEIDSDEQIEEKPIKKGAKGRKEEAGVKRSKRQVKATSYDELYDEDEQDEEIPKPAKSKGRAKKDTASSSKAGGTSTNKTETAYDEINFSCAKENAKGETFNTRISSWNVDGLRAWLKKNGLAYIENEKPDILCLQETKCSEDKLPPEVKNLSGYKQYWHNSDKEGYAGVALFSREEPLSVKYGIGEEEHDEEGRCITAEYEKFYVISVYVPNAGRKLVTLPKRLEWNKAFKSFVKELDKKKPVIVCGDMNVSHSEIDLSNPKTNTRNAGFTKEEREGLTEFLADGYVDTYRKFYPDEIGAYTFWTYMFQCRSKNVGWRLDYFIVSERLADNICDNVIRSEVFGSDHCPIVLFLNV